jgi:hypothetical protein
LPPQSFLLRVVLCSDCSLVQLADTVDPKIYSHYAYVTSTSTTMDKHLDHLMTHLLSTRRLGAGSKFLEIASNTGCSEKVQGGVVKSSALNQPKTSRMWPSPRRFHAQGIFNSATAKLKTEWGAADLIMGRRLRAHRRFARCHHQFRNGSHAETLIAFEVPTSWTF